MKRQTSSRHLDSILSGGVSPNTSKRNLKALFKNSVKTIRSIITLHSLKRTLVTIMISIIIYKLILFINCSINNLCSPLLIIFEQNIFLK